MSEGVQTTSGSWRRNPPLDRVAELRQREDQIFPVLAPVIGALTGLAVVTFILLAERMGNAAVTHPGTPIDRAV